jgi:hypothetical protein
MEQRLGTCTKADISRLKVAEMMFLRIIEGKPKRGRMRDESVRIVYKYL